MLCFAKVMRRFASSSNWFFRLCCAATLFICAAASVTGYYERWPFWTGEIAEGSIEPYEILMLKGTAPRPYVYRHLLPDLANFAAKAAPARVQESLYRLVFPLDKSKGISKFNLLAEVEEPVRKAWFFPCLFLYLLTFASALLAVIGMYLVCKAFGMPTPVSAFASVLTIAFIVMASWIALRFDWWWLLPIAVLGAWNKESFFFFVPLLFPFLRQRASTRNASAAVGTLMFVCGLVYLYSRARFAQNAGTPVEFGLGGRLSSFLDRFLLLTATDEVYGLRLFRVSTLLPTLFLCWAFARVWSRFSDPLRKHGKIGIAINFPLYALFCSPNEYRNLSLLSIVFLMTIAFNLQEWLGRSMPLMTVTENSNQ